MHYFSYKHGELYAEGIPLAELAAKFGTPLYIYSAKTLRRHFTAYEKAFGAVPHIVCFAMKANSNSGVLSTLAHEGSGADIVSGGELFRALKAGIPAGKIVYAGVGKTEDEIKLALKNRILMFNVESEDELEEIDRVAGLMRVKAPVALRVNPDVDPRTHPYISTGMKKYKFGIPVKEALPAYKAAARMKNISVVGIQKHIGSQLTELEPFEDSLNRLLALLDLLEGKGMKLKYLDIGGGLGIRYTEDENPPAPAELAKVVLPLIKGRDVTLIVEPGRSIVGNAGVLVTKCLYRKSSGVKDFVIVDAGMNDLVRPSLYGAHHDILPVRKAKRPLEKVDVVGPVCESGDFLARDRQLPATARGELLAVMSAGAYGFTMGSNYNSRPRPAEVLVDGDEYRLVRKRETYRDLTRGEM
ncbi:MAG: diaminopimelate decarboxylase [Actinomycetota bacterium]|nr:diaminopimelate decarboxylase [Actinomycetota bacterium]